MPVFWLESGMTDPWQDSHLKNFLSTIPPGTGLEPVSGDIIVGTEAKTLDKPSNAVLRLPALFAAKSVLS